MSISVFLYLLFSVSIRTFTITAEILPRSLANFHRQYTNRHKNKIKIYYHAQLQKEGKD